MVNINEVIIIGGGPAGLSAALYNGRAGLNPLVLAGSPPGGQLMLTTEVENFPGYNSILGPDLILKLQEQAKLFGSNIINENVKSVDFSKKPFLIKTAKSEYQSESVIIATGAQALWLGLDSEQRLRGKGVSACATCDGFFFKNKIVAVVGGGDTALEEAQTLTHFAKKVYVIHRRDSFRASKIMQARVLANKNIEIIWNTKIAEVLGEQKVTGVILQQDKSELKKLAVDGLFIAIGHKPDTDLFKNQIILDQKGYILTTTQYALACLQDPKVQNEMNSDYQMMTSADGVFAAGDCVDHDYRQAGTAAGMGIAAALEAERWLQSL